VLIVTHELDTLNYGNKTYSMDAGNLAPHTACDIVKAEKTSRPE
jgi:hypothetical protein